MKTVTSRTRAPRQGKLVYCPHCGAQSRFFHFSWSACQCQSCEAMVEKPQWLLEDPKIKHDRNFMVLVSDRNWDDSIYKFNEHLAVTYGYELFWVDSVAHALSTFLSPLTPKAMKDRSTKTALGVRTLSSMVHRTPSCDARRRRHETASTHGRPRILGIILLLRRHRDLLKKIKLHEGELRARRRLKAGSCQSSSSPAASSRAQPFRTHSSGTEGSSCPDGTHDEGHRWTHRDTPSFRSIPSKSPAILMILPSFHMLLLFPLC